MHKESSHCGQEDEDFFQKAGVQLSIFLNTETRRWCSLFLVASMTGVACGPWITFASLEPILIQEGVWAGANPVLKLSQLLSTTGACVILSGYPAGIIYDAIGARALSVIGLLITAFCFVGMALAVQVHQLNGLLWFLCPIGAIAGTNALYAPFPWLWLLPDHSSMVAAIIGVLQIIPELMNLLVIDLNKSCGLRLQTYFAFLACMSACCALIVWMVVPSQQDVLRIAHVGTDPSSTSVGKVSSRSFVPSRQDLLRIAHMGTDPGSTSIGKASSREYGATSDDHGLKALALMDENEVPAPTIGEAFQKSWMAVMGTWKLLSKKYPTVSFLFFFYQVAQYMFGVYPGVMMYPLYLDLLGKARAKFLLGVWAAIGPVAGCAWTLLLGDFVGRFDLAQATAWIVIPTVIQGIAFSSTSLAFQMVGQVMLCLTSNTWRVLQVRFAVLYGCPELFGTIYGSFNLPQGITQLVAIPLCNWIFKNRGYSLADDRSFMAEHGFQASALPMLKQMDLWCILTVVTSVFVVVYWWFHPLPEPGSTTMADVLDPDVERCIEEKRSILASEQPALKQRNMNPACNCWACLKINHV
jgi:hypothetical protein